MNTGSTGNAGNSGCTAQPAVPAEVSWLEGVASFQGGCSTLKHAYICPVLSGESPLYIRLLDPNYTLSSRNIITRQINLTALSVYVHAFCMYVCMHAMSIAAHIICTQHTCSMQHMWK